VLSTRIRLARNLEGMPFPGWAKAPQRKEISDRCVAALDALPKFRRGHVLRMGELGDRDRAVLVERHLVSKELAAGKSGAAVISRDQTCSVMVNEEDHLRIQVVKAGWHLRGTLRDAERLDRELGAEVPYAWHPEFGFLTSCPTNTGTGMPTSVLIHLPGLVLTQEIGKVLQGLQHMGLTYRGLYGEGSEVLGNYFQISNQTTLGRGEDELADQLVRVVRRVIEREEEARRVLQRDAGYIIEDKLWRAYGTLRHARTLPAEEAMTLLSGVRLAAGLNLVSGLSVYTLNKLLIFSQAAHLARAAGRPLTDGEANLARARYVRQVLAAESRLTD